MTDVREAVRLLKEEYPDAKCALNYETPLQLLIAVQLSAQCTDARVNLITPALFERYPDAKAFAEADKSELEEYIKSGGFFRTKSANIIACCKMIVSDYGGELPDTMEELTKLPGVGRKTANLILGDVFGQPSYVVDTHCMRITRRLGMTDETEPEKIEKDLRKILPPEESGEFCHRIVLHGRKVCTARKAKCSECVLDKICPKNL